MPLTFTDPGLPFAVASVESALTEPDGLEAALGALVRGARDCLPTGASGDLPRALA